MSKLTPIDRVDLVDLAPEHAAPHREVLDQFVDAQQWLGHRMIDSDRQYRMQATLWPASTVRSAGSASVQAGCANRQRGANRQPGGGSIRLGTMPPIASSRTRLPALRSMRGIERIRPCV